jgi:hypothetical protein
VVSNFILLILEVLRRAFPGSQFRLLNPLPTSPVPPAPPH